MNTLISRLPTITVELHNHIVEVVPAEDATAAMTAATRFEPAWRISTLQDYDATMRRHATACESGR
ncbi:MAG TPA: hypothetical protein VIF60_07830 [Burkholderiaceae bacterium]|jgi:hypothetical protein